VTGSLEKEVVVTNKRGYSDIWPERAIGNDARALNN
jgi:hypothetical protein